jgi:acetyl-CoA decarbonylase/synthase complex subunit beta
MPEKIKERVYDFIPDEVKDKIPSEESVSTVNELKQFLEDVEHPVVDRWEAMIEEAPEEVKAIEKVSPTKQFATVPSITTSFGGYEFTLENVKIHADKVRIKKIDSGEG